MVTLKIHGHVKTSSIRKICLTDSWACIVTSFWYFTHNSQFLLLNHQLQTTNQPTNITQPSSTPTNHQLSHHGFFHPFQDLLSFAESFFSSENFDKQPRSVVDLDVDGDAQRLIRSLGHVRCRWRWWGRKEKMGVRGMKVLMKARCMTWWGEMGKFDGMKWTEGWEAYWEVYCFKWNHLGSKLDLAFQIHWFQIKCSCSVPNAGWFTKYPMVFNFTLMFLHFMSFFLELQFVLLSQICPHQKKAVAWA